MAAPDENEASLREWLEEVFKEQARKSDEQARKRDEQAQKLIEQVNEIMGLFGEGAQKTQVVRNSVEGEVKRQEGPCLEEEGACLEEEGPCLEEEGLEGGRLEEEGTFLEEEQARPEEERAFLEEEWACLEEGGPCLEEEGLEGGRLEEEGTFLEQEQARPEEERAFLEEGRAFLEEEKAFPEKEEMREREERRVEAVKAWVGGSDGGEECASPTPPPFPSLSASLCHPPQIVAPAPPPYAPALDLSGRRALEACSWRGWVLGRHPALTSRPRRLRSRCQQRRRHGSQVPKGKRTSAVGEMKMGRRRRLYTKARRTRTLYLLDPHTSEPCCCGCGRRVRASSVCLELRKWQVGSAGGRGCRADNPPGAAASWL